MLARLPHEVDTIAVLSDAQVHQRKEAFPEWVNYQVASRNIYLRGMGGLEVRH